MTVGRVPSSTYRLQITADFTLTDADAQVDYLADLGVGWLYLSPVLASEPGSSHGYDVIDHGRVDPARGGEAALRQLCEHAHAAGLGVLVDIVPNHVGVASPAISTWWNDVLRLGRGSRYATAFDIDWAAGLGKILLPVLGSGADLDRLSVDGDALVYGGNRYPLAPGTAGGSPRQVHDRQHYRLIDWRRGDTEVNYRRFFSITSLAGIRVELPAVYDESHAQILKWIESGWVDGLRLDHPDGLADPAEYLDRLAASTGGRYVVVEKILEHDEPLPQRWRCDGSTGYDALAILDRLFVDPAGEAGLTSLDTELRGVPLDWNALTHHTKRMVTDRTLRAEVFRLVRLAWDADPELTAAHEAMSALLAEFAIYRTYLVPDLARVAPVDRDRDRAELASAVARARARRPDLTADLGRLERLLADPATELCRRFQQTSGMVMAKGVEDCAFYRASRLTSLTEVGADPQQWSLSAADFHAVQQQRQRTLPQSMVALSTHDTKRSEDTRARIAVLAEVPDEWTSLVRQVRDRTTDLGALDADLPLLNLVLQGAVGVWPVDPQRLGAFALKAAREAAVVTTHISPNAGYEGQLLDVTHRIAAGPLTDLVGEFADRIIEAGRSNSLAVKLAGLTVPGVPDIYQGTELWDYSLVDPDNRRPVDYRLRRELRAGSSTDPDGSVGAVKQHLVATVLRLRRDRPELFSEYRPVLTSGAAADHLVAFDRGGLISVLTRLPIGLSRSGGWRDTTVALPAGQYVDVLTGRQHQVGEVGLAAAQLLTELPVALLLADPDRH